MSILEACGVLFLVAVIAVWIAEWVKRSKLEVAPTSEELNTRLEKVEARRETQDYYERRNVLIAHMRQAGLEFKPHSGDIFTGEYFTTPIWRLEYKTLEKFWESTRRIRDYQAGKESVKPQPRKQKWSKTK